MQDIRRKDLNNFAPHILFVASRKKRSTRSGQVGTFLWVGAYVIMCHHVSSRGFSMLPTYQTPKSRQMSPKSIMKLDSSGKLKPPTTPSPPVTFDNSKSKSGETLVR